MSDLLPAWYIWQSGASRLTSNLLGDSCRVVRKEGVGLVGMCTFQTDYSTETSTKTHVEIPAETTVATYANGTQWPCRYCHTIITRTSNPTHKTRDNMPTQASEQTHPEKVGATKPNKIKLHQQTVHWLFYLTSTTMCETKTPPTHTELPPSKEQKVPMEVVIEISLASTTDMESLLSLHSEVIRRFRIIFCLSDASSTYYIPLESSLQEMFKGACFTCAFFKFHLQKQGSSIIFSYCCIQQ